MPASALFPARRAPDRAKVSLQIAVLMGGVSSEREVSLRSGEGVARGLASRGHEVTRVVVDEDGPRALDALPPVDAAFVALHGRFGEDGGVQRMLEARGVAYTGSGPEASARAFDKAWTKSILRARGVPVASDVLLDFPWRARDVRQALRRAPGPRLVVKPVREGSSVGVHICATLAQAARAVRALRSFRQPLLVEEFVEGREVTVAVLGEEILPPVEIVPARAFYDTTAKYDPTSGTRYDVAPSLSPAVLARAKEVALEAHRALGCRDVSRTDVRIDPSGRPFVLEVNTIPGLTPTSLLPKAAAAAGIPFDELCEKLIRLALGRGRA
jgi:D-alanine-D-alanine ligase